MARALVVGGEGQIGAALLARLAVDGWQTVATTRRLDAPDGDSLFLDLSGDLTDWRPPENIAVAFLCAAVTSVAKCQADPAGTRRLNVDALWKLSEALLTEGAFVVLPSTNLVFDGSLPCRAACDPACPLTEYGRQKADLERLLLARAGQTAVVRLTKVLDAGTPLLREWATALRAGAVIRPFSDMVMAPVTVDLATEALLRVGARGLSGITQVSAVEDVTYEEAARRLAAQLGARDELIQPIRAAGVGVGPEAAPRHTTLDTSRLRQEIGLEPPQPGETLELVCGQLAAEAH